MQELGKGCLLGKSDVKSAFRTIPVAKNEFDQLWFCFNNWYYFDKALPFGCSISCATYERFATFLEFAVRRRSTVGRLPHYLDDFPFGGKKGTNHCKVIMTNFQACMSKLGVPIASEKTEDPTTVLCFLGLELDSDEMVVRLPMDKVHDIIQKIEAAMSKRKVTLKALQSIIGVLQFACRAIIPGRPFCCRLINATCCVSNPYHHIRVTQNMQKANFLRQHNGISVFHDRFWISSAEAELYSALALAFTLRGNGHVLHGQRTWQESGLTRDITVLELFPILVSLYLWGSKLCNKKILFHCDNAAVNMLYMQ